MNLFFLFGFLLTGFQAHADSLDLDQKLSCEVIGSNMQNVPVGTSTLAPISLNEVRTAGAIALANPSHRFLDFYGPMEAFNTFSGKSRYVTFAKRSGEIQGSIQVQPTSDQNLLLGVTLTLMTRVYDPATGKPTFVLGSQMEIYKLLCKAT